MLLGTDDRYIAALDGNGAALAAIQVLRDLVEQQQVEDRATKWDVAKSTLTGSYILGDC